MTNSSNPKSPLQEFKEKAIKKAKDTKKKLSPVFAEMKEKIVSSKDTEPSSKKKSDFTQKAQKVREQIQPALSKTKEDLAPKIQKAKEEIIPHLEQTLSRVKKHLGPVVEKAQQEIQNRKRKKKN